MKLNSITLGINKWRQYLLGIGMTHALFVIPLHEKGRFKELKFSSIPPHKVEFTQKGMKVKVHASAMPLIYPFDQKKNLTQIEGEIHVSDLIQLKKKEIQGSKKNNLYKDDYILRIGFVLEGDKTLNWFQKKMAPAWVNELYNLAPEGEGVDKIYFLNMTQQKAKLLKKGVHPLGKGLMEEVNQWYIEKPGSFSFKAPLNFKKKVHALWISIDGDDTKSKYEILIKKLNLHEKSY